MLQALVLVALALKCSHSFSDTFCVCVPGGVPHLPVWRALTRSGPTQQVSHHMPTMFTLAEV